MDQIRNYINIINEQQSPLYEMANIGSNIHHVDGVVIWIGETNGQHGPRVKVSKIRGTFDKNDNFSIRLPHLDYDFKQVPKWIDSKMMKQLLEWIKNHMDSIYKFEKGELHSTNEFIVDLKKPTNTVT